MKLMNKPRRVNKYCGLCKGMYGSRTPHMLWSQDFVSVCGCRKNSVCGEGGLSAWCLSCTCMSVAGPAALASMRFCCKFMATLCGW